MLAAVTRPLPSRVKTGTALAEPKEPVLELTVARVVDVEPAEVLISPVKAGIFPAGRAGNKEEFSVPVLILLAFVVSMVADGAREADRLAMDAQRFVMSLYAARKFARSVEDDKAEPCAGTFGLTVDVVAKAGATSQENRARAVPIQRSFFMVKISDA